MQGSGEIGARPLPDAYVRRATARLKYKAAPPPHAPLVPDFKASVSSSKSLPAPNTWERLPCPRANLRQM